MDREKVIKGLEAISDYFFDIYRNDTDSYKCEKAQEYSDAAIDAISMLKKLEPKQVEAEVINEIDRLYRCPSCHISMILRKQPYCHSCGQEVKWE